MSASLLTGHQIGTDRVEIIIEFAGVRRPVFPDFGNNRVIHRHSPKNSSGKKSYGQINPQDSTTAEIFTLVSALFMGS